MQQFSVRTVVLVATLCAAATTIHAQQSSCRDARDNGGVSVDGDQTIRLTLGGRTVTLFCYMMGPDVNQTEAPYAYITLNQPNTAELITSHSTDPEGMRRVRTTFTKVRVDEATGKVHTGDFTFATTTIDDIDLTMLAISNACNPGCQRIGVSCPAPQDGLYNALGVPFGMSGVCTATTDSCTFPATAPPDRNSATATIDLSGTGFRLKDTMTIDSQFVYLDELATVKQPPPSTQVTVGNRRFGANSNVTTTSNSSLTSIVTLGVRPDAGSRLRDAIANLDFELTGNPNDCVVNARLAAPFCDFAMHYGWFSDIAALGLDESVSMPALEYNCPTPFTWPSQFTAVGPSMSDRLTDIVSGGFGVCLCLDDGTGCGDGNCTWGIASDSGDTAGFQQNFYTLATATRCDSSTQYEISAFTDTNDTVCAALTVCLPGQYVSVRPSRTSNRECLRCTNGFTVANNIGTCQLWDDCAAGQYVLNRPTSSSDRTCGDCVNGTNFTAQPNENACAPVVNCDAGQSVSVQPSVSNNRECTDCVSAYSTAENAAGCTDWTPCEVVFNRCDVFDTNYNGGVCDCDGSAANSLGCPTTVEYTEPSATSDRVCTGCPAEAFYDSVGALCVQLTAECDANQGLLERAAPTTTSDRDCDTLAPTATPTSPLPTAAPTYSAPSPEPTVDSMTSGLQYENAPQMVVTFGGDLSEMTAADQTTFSNEFRSEVGAASTTITASDIADVVLAASSTATITATVTFVPNTVTTRDVGAFANTVMATDIEIEVNGVQYSTQGQVPVSLSTDAGTSSGGGGDNDDLAGLLVGVIVALAVLLIGVTLLFIRYRNRMQRQQAETNEWTQGRRKGAQQRDPPMVLNPTFENRTYAEIDEGCVFGSNADDGGASRSLQHTKPQHQANAMYTSAEDTAEGSVQLHTSTMYESAAGDVNVAPPSSPHTDLGAGGGYAVARASGLARKSNASGSADRESHHSLVAPAPDTLC